MKNFGAYLKDRHVYEFYEEPLFIQSEYYSLYFQKAVEEFGDKLDIKSILITSAQEVSYAQFKKLFDRKKKYGTEDRKAIVEKYFSNCGFGRLNLRAIQAKGGNVEVYAEHYAMAWIRHFGQRAKEESGVGYFTQGFLCGIMEAVFNCRPGTFDGKQLKCISKGDEFSKFEIYRGFRRKISVSPAMGKTQDTSEEPIQYTSKLIDTIVDMQMSGSSDENGLINQFDQTLTLHYANYFALASIKLLMQANKKLGAQGFQKVKETLVDISERNAYFLFGKIINSVFWQQYLSSNPSANADGNLKNCTDILTAFGLGHWELNQTDQSKTSVNIVNCPESNAYLQLVGNSKVPIGFYNCGMLMGLANLLDKGPNTDDEVGDNYVNKFVGENNFEFFEERSRMTGGESDMLVVSQV